MKPLGPTAEHYFLALGMAEVAGVDVQSAVEEGRFNQEKWAALVQRCRACDWGAECPSWLQRNQQAENAPEACVNARIFASLKAGGDPREDWKLDE